MEVLRPVLKSICAFLIGVILSRQALSAPAFPHGIEVMTATQGKTIFAAWVDDSGLGVDGFRCSLSRSSDDGITWQKQFTYKNPSYEVGVNPLVILIKSRIYYLCMSANSADKGGGIFEMRFSDDKGQTWSPWKQVLKTEIGIPDKPWLLSVNGGLLLSYAEVNISKSEDSVKLQSDLKVALSLDDGLTFSSPTTIYSGLNKDDEMLKIHVRGGQGSFLNESSGGKILLSYGDYSTDGSGKIFVRNLKLKNGVLEVGKAITVADEEVRTPITSIKIAPNGLIYLYWYQAHDFSVVKAVVSRDEGESWGKPVTVSESGTQAIANITASGDVQFFYNYLERGIRTSIMASVFSSDLHFNSQRTLSNSAEFPKDSYVGAYSDLIKQANGVVSGVLAQVWLNGSSSIFQLPLGL